jgi:hypothetical protein
MEESILLNRYEMVSSHIVNLKIGGRRELSLHTVLSEEQIKSDKEKDVTLNFVFTVSHIR